MSKRTLKSYRVDQRSQQRTHVRRRALVLGFAGVLLTVILGAFALRPNAQGGLSPSTASLDKSKGAADAPVVVMEYGDFQCPACRQFTVDAKRRLEDDYVSKGQVRFVFRNFAFLGAESQWAAEAAECANDQGRLWDYYDKIFKEQNGENVGTFVKENLKRFAADLSLDTGQFNACLDSGKYTDKVRQETREGQLAGVRGTPTIFVNDKLINKASNYVVLQKAIEALLD